MKKYEVSFIQRETFKVIVTAKNKKLAEIKAGKMFDEGDYEEVGDCKVEQSNVVEIKM